jgi:hypothetical protein
MKTSNTSVGSIAEVKSILRSGIQIERSDKELRLTKAWYDKKNARFLIFFASLWNLIIGVFWLYIPIEIILTQDLTKLSQIVFLIPHTIIGLLFIYYLIAIYKNYIVISVTDTVLIVEHEPLPWVITQRISSSKLLQLYVKQEGILKTKKEVIKLYDLCAKLKDGTDVKLLSSLPSEDVGQFLEKQIEQYLGIIDQPIEGEISNKCLG